MYKLQYNYYDNYLYFIDVNEHKNTCKTAS